MAKYLVHVKITHRLFFPLFAESETQAADKPELLDFLHSIESGLSPEDIEIEKIEQMEEEKK